MPEDTQTGSQAEPTKQHGLTSPEVAGLDKGEETGDDTRQRYNPRADFLADMDDKIDAHRAQEIEQNRKEFIDAGGDEEFIAGFETQGEETTTLEEEGLQSREVMHPKQGEVEETAGLPPELESDPLAEYIVMDGENPMFRTKVDGEERYIPLDQAKVQLQKSVAAEVRLQQVASQRKQLDEREAQIRANEAALQIRMNQAASPPPNQDVSDQGQEDEVREVVESLFTGTESQAVDKLSKLLAGRDRAVNTGEIANQAVAAARQLLVDEQAADARVTRTKDINSGYEQFGKDYPEIVKDPNLFAYADNMTDSISADNPGWDPSRVMAEAGKQTSEWVKSLRGDARPVADPAADRRTNKRKLKPMPRPGSGAAQVGENAEPVETPTSMLAEIRRQRGQG